MPPAEEQSRKKLRLVEPRHELKGNAPRGFERLVRACTAADGGHKAALFAATTLTRRALQQCLPPSLAGAYLSELETVVQWARSGGNLKAVNAARSRTFESLPEAQAKTLTALGRLLALEGAQRATPLDEHADRVMHRYVARSVYHAVACVLLCCDGVLDPRKLVDVPGDVAGSIAYRNVALGPARSDTLRQRAIDSAAWESAELAMGEGHEQSALTLQLFHEYLGVHWKNHVDAQRVYLEQFLDWAFASK
ncbi:MAG TPA: hypothetical protein VHM70_14565 [Polyangiaceae bacterium]|nr:hypothetical protein [Polyangiaceae bacterium]